MRHELARRDRLGALRDDLGGRLTVRVLQGGQFLHDDANALGKFLAGPRVLAAGDGQQGGEGDARIREDVRGRRAVPAQVHPRSHERDALLDLRAQPRVEGLCASASTSAMLAAVPSHSGTSPGRGGAVRAAKRARKSPP